VRRIQLTEARGAVKERGILTARTARKMPVDLPRASLQSHTQPASFPAQHSRHLPKFGAKPSIRLSLSAALPNDRIALSQQLQEETQTGTQLAKQTSGAAHARN